ncbi:MAG: c-di-GMP-binding flagellar brake protein YcgR [Nitrospinales bacterium]|jgi:c-di-GMP-binding flagellar brake protein YcgR
MAYKKQELPLVMGQKVTITVRGEVFNVLVRGWRKGQYIILDLPRVGVEDFRIAPQTGIQVHFTKEGLFVNFKSTSVLSFVQAIALLVIEYPRTFDSHNLRKNERFKANFPIRYHYEADGQKFEDSGIVRDISASGILFTHTKQVVKDNKLYLNFEIPNCGSIQNQMADIRNIRKNPKSETSPFVTGIKWRDISPETEASIAKLVQSRLADRRNEMR